MNFWKKSTGKHSIKTNAHTHTQLHIKYVIIPHAHYIKSFSMYLSIDPFFLPIMRAIIITKMEFIDPSLKIGVYTCQNALRFSY